MHSLHSLSRNDSGYSRFYEVINCLNKVEIESFCAETLLKTSVIKKFLPEPPLCKGRWRAKRDGGIVNFFTKNYYAAKNLC